MAIDDAGAPQSLAALERRIVGCRACTRLVAWRERVAVEKRAAYADQHYWGAPVPGFGDPRARLVVLGLAPAAHGANRTGRVFTGDRSGDFLFAALHRAGFANQPTSEHRSDGLRLRNCWISAAVRCAPPGNRPLPVERDACAPFLQAELQALPAVVVLALGRFAWDTAVATLGPVRPKPAFGHGARFTFPDPEAPLLLGSYHVSQQNTFTGRLTPQMFDDVLSTARAAF